jgi:hypothetical protein
MNAAAHRGLIEAFWRHANARDWPAFGALLAPGVLYEMPQTRERVRGRQSYVEFNRTWPGDWRVVVERIVADASQGVSEIRFLVDGQDMTGLNFFVFEAGLIQRITDYWPEAYEPPARMSTVVERC